MPARREVPVPTLAGDKVAAMRQVYAQVKKREAQRRVLSDRIRAELKTVKDRSDISPGSVREAVRINRLTPERRVKWEAKLNGALGLLGYSAIELLDNPVSPGSNSAAAARVAIEEIEAEKRAIGDEIAGYYRAAKDAGLDVAELRLFVRMGRNNDAIEMGEWRERIDETGEALGIWDGIGGDDTDDGEEF